MINRLITMLIMMSCISNSHGSCAPPINYTHFEEFYLGQTENISSTFSESEMLFLNGEIIDTGTALKKAWFLEANESNNTYGGKIVLSPPNSQITGTVQLDNNELLRIQALSVSGSILSEIYISGNPNNTNEFSFSTLEGQEKIKEIEFILDSTLNGISVSYIAYRLDNPPPCNDVITVEHRSGGGKLSSYTMLGILIYMLIFRVRSSLSSRYRY